MMCKKDIILFVSIFCVLALISGSTFAYWGWFSDTNKSVVFNTSHGIEDYVVYDEGDAHFVGNFQPSSTYCGGKSNTISFYKTSEVASQTLMATIYMDVNSIESNIKNSEYVKWAITSGDSSSCGDALASGKFYGKNNGDVITVLENEEITTSTKTFTVWLWIDSSGTNLSNLSGETIDVNIWTQIDMTDGSQIDTETDEGNGDSSTTESCVIYYHSWPLILGQSSQIGTQEIIEGEPFNLMNFDNGNISLDGGNACYNPGATVSLACSSVVYVDTTGNRCESILA